MAAHPRWLGWAMTGLVIVAAGPFPASKAAEPYPTRPVSILTQAPVGTGPDVIARVVADRLTKAWQREVLIVNRPGAGGLIALQAAAASAGDGYTLYMPLSSTFIALPERHPKLPLDLQHDLVPIGLVGEQPMVIAVNAKLGVSTLSEFVALARKQPGRVRYGANQGSLPNLVGELLQQRAAVKFTFVPYGKMSQAVQDAVGGTVDVAIESLAGLAAHIKSGALKPLAVASSRRVPDYPDLPTVMEALPKLGRFEATGWLALMARTGTPDAIVRQVATDLQAVLAGPDIRKKFAALGTYVRPLPPSEVAAFIRSEQALWRPIVKRVAGADH